MNSDHIYFQRGRNDNANENRVLAPMLESLITEKFLKDENNQTRTSSIDSD